MAWRLINYVRGQLYLNLSVNVLKPTKYGSVGTEKCSEQNENVFQKPIHVHRIMQCSVMKYVVYGDDGDGQRVLAGACVIHSLCSWLRH
jgi:hypothetical protein